VRPTTLDGVGHFPQQEAPTATNRALVEFLAGQSV
jgi:pimeloyl-ACP methyl ester carboxylesterase